MFITNRHSQITNRKSLRLLWCVAALFLLTAVPAQGAIVRLRETGRAAAAVVVLGDVAEVLDADASRAAELRAVTLIPAPPAGQERSIDHAAIRDRLQAFGFNLAEIEFAGSSVTRVSGSAIRPKPARPRPAPIAAPSQPAAPQRAAVVSSPPPRPRSVSRFQTEQAETIVTEAVQQYVARQAPQAGEIEVEVQLEPEQVEALLATVNGECRVVSGELTWDEPRPFTLACRDPRGAGGELRLTCRVTPRPVVLAVRRAVSKGERVQAADLVWKQVASADDALTRPEDVIGREATRTLRAGEPLQPDDVQRVPLVRAGDLVTLSVRRPGLSVKRIMKARGHGAEGETVTLVTLDNRETLTARVTGFHEAEPLTAADTTVNVTGPQGAIQFLPGEGQ